MSASGLSKTRLARMHETMAAHVDSGHLPGLVALVSRHDEVHVDAIGTLAFGGDVPMRRNTIFRIASMSKPVVAAAAMMLVEECKLRLDESVERWLPELANRRVLKRLDGPLDDTVPAHRSITLRDLLTFRFGMGLIMAPPGRYPVQQAVADAGLAPGPNPPTCTPDEWMQRLGTLPLLHQPGEQWMYHTGSDVLGVLIARAAGQTLETFLRERLFDPLGMHDTGFFVPAEKLNRFAHAYGTDRATGAATPYDDARDSRWGKPPAFASGGGGLVSTVGDYLAFCQMLLNKGRVGHEHILSRPTVELMTSDQLTPEQKAGTGLFFGASSSWGFGMAVTTRRDNLWAPGRFGWDGGIGTSAYSDPNENMVGILMTQRLMQSPEPPPVFVDFWTSAYQAIDD